MSSVPTITFHGAAGTVTGSCMELRHGGKTILIDCGLFQGSRTLETLNRDPFAFDVRKIDAVVLTHAHIDHSGLLPRLTAEGYRGPIFATPQTRDLLYYMLPDAGRIQSGEQGAWGDRIHLPTLTAVEGVMKLHPGRHPAGPAGHRRGSPQPL